MSQQINIPVGADTSGFYSELKKAFDWAKREADSVRMGGGGFSGGGGGYGSKEGGIGNRVNSALNSRMPDPNRVGLHELGQGGFIRTFESQMHTAGFVAIKTQELVQKASLGGISNWASKLASSVKDIVSPLGRGAMGIAKMGGSAINFFTPSFDGKSSNRKGSGIDYSLPSIIPEPHEPPLPERHFPVTPFESIPKNLRRNNRPIDLSPYDDRNNVIPTIHPQPNDGSVPPSGGGNRNGNPYWRDQPRDERGRFIARANAETTTNSSTNSIVGDSRGYRITANIVHITANIVHITTGVIQQGTSGMGGTSGTANPSGNRQPTGRPPGIAENISPTPSVPRPPKPRPPLLFVSGNSVGSPPPVIADPKIERSKRPPKDPLAIAGDSIASEVFSRKSQEKHDPKPSFGERLKNGAGKIAEGAGQVVSGVKGTAGSMLGAAGAVIGVAAIGLTIASAMAGVVSDLGEKYTQQAMKQSDTVGALGGRISGGGGYFVNEEVARANIASARISGNDVYGKGNQISQYEMKFASSMGVGLSEMSGMLAHIRKAEGEAATIDSIRRKGALLGYKNLQMLEFVQKNVEYDQQRTQQGFKSNFGDVIALAKNGFKDLTKEGKVGAAQQLAGTVQSRFGANIMSDMIISKKMSEGKVNGIDDMINISKAIEMNQAGALMEFLKGTDKSTRESIAYQMMQMGQISAVQASAISNYTDAGGSEGKSSKSALESAFKADNTKVDPVRALTNFLAGHENRQQAIFLNGIGATAYEMSVKLQQQQMDLVKNHKEAFMQTAEMINNLQSKVMSATAKMIEFTTDIINNVTDFMNLDSTRGFVGKLKKFMEDFTDNIGNALKRSNTAGNNRLIM